MITCTNKHWTWQDTFRGILAGTFIPAGGEEIPKKAIKMVVVEDSGEPYFCGDNKFKDIDHLAKQLSGLYSDELPEIALRVSVGTTEGATDRCEHPARSYTELEMLLSAIGKGTDGKPLLRLAISGLPETGSGE